MTTITIERDFIRQLKIRIHDDAMEMRGTVDISDTVGAGN
jgi:hypothetical protein